MTGKSEIYERVLTGVRQVIDGERDWIANLANCAAILFQTLPDVNWTGFYLQRGTDRVPGPFQDGPRAGELDRVAGYAAQLPRNARRLQSATCTSSRAYCLRRAIKLRNCRPACLRRQADWRHGSRQPAGRPVRRGRRQASAVCRKPVDCRIRLLTYEANPIADCRLSQSQIDEGASRGLVDTPARAFSGCTAWN